jgi:ribose transport system permease protein
VNRSPSRLIATHGVLIGLISLCVLFSILLPDTFPTQFNLQSILSTNAVILLLALAVMVPMSAGSFDLSVGYGLGLIQVVVMILMIQHGWAWPIAVAASVGCGILIGLINGLLVTVVKIDSFIATLGLGSTMFGVTQWITHSRQIAGPTSHTFTDLTQTTLFGFLPLPAVYAIVACIVLWVLFEFLPLGRHFYAVGMNRRSAELVGLPTGRYIVLAFVISGALVGIAGVILGSQLRAGNPTIGPEYLLPAFVGAFLGSTTVRPGRVNVWGTFLAVALLAVGISGLQLEGAESFIVYLFNGLALLIAVGASGFAARRRVRMAAK